MSNSIRQVALEIETANGEYHKLVVGRPTPLGDNPRFMGQQLQSALEDLSRRAADILAAYGDQITR